MQNKKNKNILGFGVLHIIVIVAVAVLLGIIYWFANVSYLNNPTVDETTEKIELSNDVKKVLDSKVKLIDDFASKQNFVDMVVSLSKGMHDNLTDFDVERLDKLWKENANADNEWISEHLSNEMAIALTEFQENNAGFPEIFVTDKRGLNVGQTNITSDFYQADEDWWVITYNEGKGYNHYGEIEYDESAKSESIPIFVAVKDTDGEVVGVVKAVLDLNQVIKEI